MSPRRFVVDVFKPVAAVLLVGLLLFGATGVWPPMVAVESASMEPGMAKGDLVVVSAVGRYAPSAAGPDGVATAREAPDHHAFGRAGDVVVYLPPGREGAPIIHRVRFAVENGENWYDRANPRYVAGADNCAELKGCPAPYDGYITKGDNNAYYDQATGLAPVVKRDWLVAEAHFRIPELGWLRLVIAGKA